MNFKKVFAGILGKKFGPLKACSIACRTGGKNTVAILSGDNEPGHLPRVLISAPEKDVVQESFPEQVVEYSAQELIAEDHVQAMYEEVEGVLCALRTHTSSDDHVAITLQVDVLRAALAGVPDGDEVQVVIARNAIQFEALHEREKKHAVMGVYHGAGEYTTVIALRGDAVYAKKFDGVIPHAVPRRKVAMPVVDEDDLFGDAVVDDDDLFG